MRTIAASIFLDAWRERAQAGCGAGVRATVRDAGRSAAARSCAVLQNGLEPRLDAGVPAATASSRAALQRRHGPGFGVTVRAASCSVAAVRESVNWQRWQGKRGRALREPQWRQHGQLLVAPEP